MKIDKANLISLAMVIILVAIAVAGHYASPLLLPKADVSGQPAPGCDLQRQPCTTVLPGGERIELSITPRPIPFLKTLRIEITLAGMTARKVEADFAGESMSMGYNRIELAAAGNDRYAGETSLPVCVTDKMAWIATVLVETDRQRIAVPYRFEVGL